MKKDNVIRRLKTISKIKKLQEEFENRKIRTKQKLLKRRKLAFDLRVKGNTYRQIAKKLGVSYVQVSNDIKYITNRMEKETIDLASRDRQIELTRLDKMYLALEPRIRKGDEFAIDRALKIMQQRAKYIPNYEEPNRLLLGEDKDNPFEIEMAQQECLMILQKMVPNYEEIKLIDANPKEITNGNEKEENSNTIQE